MLKLLSQYAKGKTVLILFLITQLVYAIIIFVTIPKVMAFANGMALPDMMPMGYSVDYVRDLFTKLGTEGRNTYLTQQIPLDMIYPGLFGVMYALLLTYLLKVSDIKNQWLYYCAFFAILGGFFDYLENFSIITIILSFPDIQDWMAISASICTLGKSIFSTFYFCVLLVVLIIFLVKKTKSS